MYVKFYTLEVKPMVTTVKLNYVRRIPCSLVLFTNISFRILALQKIVFDVLKLAHTSPAE